MKKQRRKFTKEFKLKVILDSLKEAQTVQELGSKYEIHSNQISTWKREFLEKAPFILEVKLPKEEKKEKEAEQEKLYSKIGQLQMEVDFLKKKLYS